VVALAIRGFGNQGLWRSRALDIGRFGDQGLWRSRALAWMGRSAPRAQKPQFLKVDFHWGRSYQAHKSGFLKICLLKNRIFPLCGIYGNRYNMSGGLMEVTIRIPIEII